VSVCDHELVDADRGDVVERLAAVTEAAVPRPGVDGAAYLRGRLDEGAIDRELVAALCRSPGEPADLVAAWAEVEPETDEAAWFVAVRALGWEVLLADPARGGDADRRGWQLIGHASRPKRGQRQ
jgi:hypothetical protein